MATDEKKKQKTVKFGKVELAVKEEAERGPFVPELIPYSEHDGVLETVAFAIHDNLPMLLIGETGVGKTSAVRNVAAMTGRDLRRVNVNGSMTAEDFSGQLLVNKDGTYWKDGVLTECMRNGYILVIDEINAAPAEILFVLHSLLDDDRYIVLTDHPDREIVRAHPEFRIFATMNPPERYSGTKEMNKALLSRFPITQTVSLPSESIEFGIISGADKVLDVAELKGFKNFVSGMRNAYNKEELEVFVSPRDLAAIIKVYSFTGNMLAAIEKTIVPRGSKAEQKAIMELARLNLATKKSPKGSADQPEEADESPKDARIRRMKELAAKMAAGSI